MQFNRSMRLKANKMGYSLNQRGLFAGVVRSTGDRSVKTNTGESRPYSRTSVLQPPCGPFPPLNLCEREVAFCVRRSSGLVISGARLWLRVNKDSVWIGLPDVDAPTSRPLPNDRDKLQDSQNGRL
jgi:DNA polymerase beta thumb